MKRGVILGVMIWAFPVVGGISVMTAPILAASSLTQSQISTMTTSLGAQIAAAKGDATTIEIAITSALQSAVGLYGADSVKPVTSSLLSYLVGAGVGGDIIGRAFAKAAIALSATDPAAGVAIAEVIRDEGLDVVRMAFSTQVGLSNRQDLASIAQSNPIVTGGIGNNQNGGLLSGDLTNTGRLNSGQLSNNQGTCLSGSCTSL